MTDQLSLFRERMPEEVNYKISGTASRVPELATEHAPGDTVFWLVQVTVGKCGYDEDADRKLSYDEQHKVFNAVQFRDQDAARNLLSHLQRAEREAAGLPNFDDVLEATRISSDSDAEWEQSAREPEHAAS